MGRLGLKSVVHLGKGAGELVEVGVFGLQSRV